MQQNTNQENYLYDRTGEDLPPGENATVSNPSKLHDVKSLSRKEIAARMAEDQYRHDSNLIQKARDIYRTSTDYMDANITNQWERNLSHFNSEHAPGSTVANKNIKRTRVFRPKTRAMVKSHEAALAVALFSTEEVTLVRPQNPSDKQQELSAKVMQAIMQYRLTETMPWFLTCVGGYQTSKIYGVVISHQYWRYESDESIEPDLDDEGFVKLDNKGNAKGKRVNIIREDKPCVDLIEPENFRFDPMCDWRDPANTSPYIVYTMPMTAGDVMEKMQNIDPRTKDTYWRPYSLDAILSTQKRSYDRTRQAREGRHRTDPADVETGNQYTTVWVHMNIVRENGEDWVFWTLGTELLLSHRMRRLVEVYPHLKNGERPFVVGCSTLEAFKNYPTGDVEQVSGIQEEINIIANQRIDNVKLVLNKRYYVRRGSQVDLPALMRNTPGGGVMMNDPDKDVKTVETNDVTSSSYEEQSRLSMEFDDLIGSFSPGAMQDNKNANRPVGNVNRMAGTAGAVQDYSIRLFVETWVEPVMKQFAKMIAAYETDAVVLTHAKDKANLIKFGIDDITDDLLQQNLIIKLDVGMGNTDPVRRVERLVYGVSQAIGIPGMQDRVKGPEITNEIFSSLGYRNASRFFQNDEEFAVYLQENPPQDPPEVQLKKLELQIRQEDNNARNERERMKLEQDRELRMMELALKQEITMEQLYTQLKIEDDRNKTNRDISAVTNNNKISEMRMKERIGTGI
jgi:hypothetical protein